MKYAFIVTGASTRETSVVPAMSVYLDCLFLVIEIVLRGRSQRKRSPRGRALYQFSLCFFSGATEEGRQGERKDGRPLNIYIHTYTEYIIYIFVLLSI